MLRRALLPAMAALCGIGMVAAAFLSAGTAAAAANGYQLTYAGQGGSTVVVRWASCVRTATGVKQQVIPYRVNAAGHPGRVHFVQRAIRRLHDATGLVFHYAGRTSYIPQAKSDGTLADRALEKHAHVPFVVAWARKGAVGGGSTLLTGTEAGVGSITWRFNPLSQLRISDAAVVIKRGHLGLRSGFGAGGTTGTLLLHELGHAAGLQHVGNEAEVMFPVVGRWSSGGYTAGDRAGLERVGADQPCMHGPWLSAL